MAHGLPSVAPKLQGLAELNEFMAYKPWATSKMLIEGLVKGAGGKDFKTGWSYPEIILAGTILATFHSLCCLVYGQGLKEDTELAMYLPKCY